MLSFLLLLGFYVALSLAFSLKILATVLGPSQCFICHADGGSCSASFGATSNWIKPSTEVQRFSDHSGIRYIT